MIAPVDVLGEMTKRSEDLHAWLKARKGMFRELDEDVQRAAAEVLMRFPRLVGDKKLRTSADPFVIALARVQGLQVVTDEKPTGNPNKPNIPDVCAGFGMTCIGVLQLIRTKSGLSARATLLDLQGVARRVDVGCLESCIDRAVSNIAHGIRPVLYSGGFGLIRHSEVADQGAELLKLALQLLNR